MEDHIQFDAHSLTLDLLDQRVLPEREERVLCRTPEDVITALQNMTVRGAPAIGVTAAFGCALAVARCTDAAAWQSQLDADLAALAAARPTAVNLRWAVERMQRVRAAAASASRAELLGLFIEAAFSMQREDVAACKTLGRHGADCIQDNDTVLTHCNAGALATAGYGTALGVIRAAIEQGKRVRVIANETRPFLQGARLTAWELAVDNIPVTVACDNACPLLMQKGLVQCVVVGADRIAANGDTANKIGTFGVALAAKNFNVPFYVAAPLSTIDVATAAGTAIPIEERPAEEVIFCGDRRISPVNVPVYNFAFDVTPANLVSGIITEYGVLRPPFGPAIAAVFKAAADE